MRRRAVTPTAIPRCRRRRGARAWPQALALAAGLLAAAPAQAQTVERDSRDTLRVCADANLLPFSNADGAGFENRLAELLGASLGIPVVYTWWPQTMGFLRNTLRARECDLVMGISAGHELVLNTNPYYRSVYALVYRRSLGIEIDSLAHPLAGDLRIGVVEKTPAVSLLRHYGYDNFEPYQLTTDTRAHQPAREMLEHVAAGRLDAAIVWGPIAGYFAPRQAVPLTVVPLVREPESVRLAFHITMGVRHGELRWKHTLNAFIRDHTAEIRALLAEYGVPQLDADGRVLEASR